MLLWELVAGPQPARTLLQAAKTAQIAGRTLHRAKDAALRDEHLDGRVGQMRSGRFQRRQRLLRALQRPERQPHPQQGASILWRALTGVDKRSQCLS